MTISVDNTELLDGSTKSHQLMVKKTLMWLSMNRPWICWSNTSGQVKTDTGRYVKFGLKGSTDIIGFTEDGQFVAVEIKTGNARLSKQQKAFQAVCKKNHVKHFVVRPGMPFELAFAE